MSASAPAASSTTVPSAVRTLDLTKTYGSGATLVRALRSVTLDIPAGPSWGRRVRASRPCCTA